MAPLWQLRRLRRDERGATILEFAFVAPTMCMLLLGAFDISHTLYTRAALQGVVQKVSRDASLETGAAQDKQDKLDAKVTAQAKALVNKSDIVITRRYYRSFADAAAAKPEPFTDNNDNDRCDAGEPYEDQNGNSVWDADGGNSGQGGAKDATVYSVQLSYPRMFPAMKLIGGSSTTKVTATTVLRNQPYDNQQSYGAVKVRNCS